MRLYNVNSKKEVDCKHRDFLSQSLENDLRNKYGSRAAENRMPQMYRESDGWVRIG